MLVPDAPTDMTPFVIDEPPRFVPSPGPTDVGAGGGVSPGPSYSYLEKAPAEPASSSGLTAPDVARLDPMVTTADRTSSTVHWVWIAIAGLILLAAVVYFRAKHKR